MHTFVINLDRSPDRLRFMIEQSDRLGFAFERVSGVDGAANVPRQMRDQFLNSPLTSGEIGCYASHLLCAEMIVRRDMPCAIILEDDVTLESGFKLAAVAAAEAAPDGWDYIHLSSHFKRSVVRVCGLGFGRTLVRHTRLPVNTAAYLLSRSGAEKWLRPRPRVRPNDMDIRYGWLDDLDIYGVYPSPASQQDNFESDIGGTHAGKRKVKDERDFSPGLMSEAYGVYWQARRVGVGRLMRGKVANLFNSARRKIDGERRVSILR